MTTTVTKSVTPTGGGDYTSLNSFDLGESTNLVTSDKIMVAEVHSGGNCITTAYGPVGWTTSDVNYLEIKAATGHQHNGIWSTSKAYAQWGNTPADPPIAVNMAGFRIRGMQIKTTDSYNALRIQITGTGGKRGIVDSCLVFGGDWRGALYFEGSGTDFGVIKNTLVVNDNDGQQAVGIRVVGGLGTPATKLKILNCTVIMALGGGEDITAIRTSNQVENLTTQNCYLRGVHCYVNEGGFSNLNKGDHDATCNNEAVTPALRNITADASTFADPNNYDFHLITSSPLKDTGVDLSGGTGEEAVTYDWTGTSRPQGPAFDIGADEYPFTPICWNYTAKFKGSKKLFKTSGGGTFPKNLRVPGNVDKRTGKMIDDGQEIDPDHYEVF